MSARTWAAHSAVLAITELFLVRCVVTPFFQYIECGPALLLIELWYLSLGLLRGLMRLWLLFAFHICVSFFYPHACIFPDGKESWDSAHTCFMCYVMERVVQDKQRERRQGSLQDATRLFRSYVKKRKPLANHKPAATASVDGASSSGGKSRVPSVVDN